MGWWLLRLTVKFVDFFTANGLFISVTVNSNLKLSRRLSTSCTKSTHFWFAEKDSRDMSPKGFGLTAFLFGSKAKRVSVVAALATRHDTEQSSQEILTLSNDKPWLEQFLQLTFFFTNICKCFSIFPPKD